MAGLDHDRRNKYPRLLSDPEKARLEEFVDAIHYSSRYVSQSEEIGLGIPCGANFVPPLDTQTTNTSIGMFSFPKR